MRAFNLCFKKLRSLSFIRLFLEFKNASYTHASYIETVTNLRIQKSVYAESLWPMGILARLTLGAAHRAYNVKITRLPKLKHKLVSN